MIVAITGGTGFIGHRLMQRHLENGDSVRVLTRSTSDPSGLPAAVHVHRGDLSSKSTNLHRFLDNVDVLYHCAGETRVLSRMYALHVLGTQRLINAASGRIRHWVQLSSVGVYGLISEGVITEQTPEHPQGVYEQTKTESDRLVSATASKGGYTYSILRPSNVFGPNMPNRSLFSMVEMIDRNLFFFIGKPGASANYVHVDNVVEGLILCGNHPSAKGRIYNISDYRTIEEFVSVIANALGKDTPRLRVPELPVRLISRLLGKLPGFPLSVSRVNALVNRSVYSIERIRQELAYSPPITMEEGLRQLVLEKK